MKELLFKAVWSNSDIMAYFGVGKTKASQIAQTAKLKYGGYVVIDKNKVYRDAVFKVYGLNAKEEMRKFI